MRNHVEQDATPRQLRFLIAIAREAGLSEAELDDEVGKRLGCATNELNRWQASELIEVMRVRRNARVDARS